MQSDGVNPVVESARFALRHTKLVELDEQGIKAAAQYIHHKMESDSYTPRTWRTHPLHLCPPEHYSPSDPRTKDCLNWIFLISSLNFSFWSEREVRDDRYAIEWREGWDRERRTSWTGYWSLVAAINRALEANIPITDPAFYCSEALCPDTLIERIFTRAPRSKEGMPLIKERIAVMREVGLILCSHFGGSFQGFIAEFQTRSCYQGTALQLVRMVTETFPSFRDETWYNGSRLYFWKRAQILVAETWAAFYPPNPYTPHPFFPQGIHQLTMFADYRIPQILHHLRILTYPPGLLQILTSHTPLSPGCKEEISIRAASILAVEALRDEICDLRSHSSGLRPCSPDSGDTGGGIKVRGGMSSVLIDFYLWDLAKKLEHGEDTIKGIQTGEVVPAHRTRSIWY